MQPPDFPVKGSGVQGRVIGLEATFDVLADLCGLEHAVIGGLGGVVAFLDSRALAGLFDELHRGHEEVDVVVQDRVEIV